METGPKDIIEQEVEGSDDEVLRAELRQLKEFERANNIDQNGMQRIREINEKIAEIERRDH